MAKIRTFFQAIWFCICPPYRHKVQSEWGFWMATHACGHLLFSKDCDRNDLEAARLLNNAAKELAHVR